MSNDNKVVSSADYVAKDVEYEKAKADLNIPTSGANISDLISENTRCCGGGGCKKKN
ncbi:MAG: hypothetical protein ACYS5F_14665 [Planctomycetota bacterium]|jgi:hypothetical protein